MTWPEKRQSRKGKPDDSFSYIVSLCVIQRDQATGRTEVVGEKHAIKAFDSLEKASEHLLEVERQIYGLPSQ